MLEWSEACDCLVWYESVVHSREQECNGEQGGQAMGSQCKKARQHFLLSFTSFGFYSWRPRFIVFETEDDLKRVKPIAWEKRGWEIVVTSKCIFAIFNEMEFGNISSSGFVSHIIGVICYLYVIKFLRPFLLWILPPWYFHHFFDSLTSNKIFLLAFHEKKIISSRSQTFVMLWELKHALKTLIDILKRCVRLHLFRVSILACVWYRVTNVRRYRSRAMHLYLSYIT